MTNPYVAGIESLRRLAESMMLDTCTITRAGEGKGPIDPETGKYTRPPRVSVYTGKCRVQVNSTVVARPGAGDRVTTVQSAELHLPVVGTEDVTVNDVAEITAATLDGALVGRQYTIASRHEKSQATSRRLRIQEATS